MKQPFSHPESTCSAPRGAGSALTLLPLAIAVIVFSTAIPIEVRSPVWPSTSFNLADFAINVFLYLPLGLALCRSPLVRVLIIGAVISIAIELSQIWSFGRFASPFDAVANSVGAAAGALVARRISRRWNVMLTGIPLTASVAQLACMVAVVLTVLSAIPAAPNNLKNWNAGFRLLLGNETTGDRPWIGRISALALIPKALTKAEVRTATASFSNSEERAAWLPHVGYLFDRPIEFKTRSRVWVSSDIAARFANMAIANDAFAVVARIAPANVQQAGPARIISYSRGTHNRNFDLGQHGERLTFRVRTANTGLNGNDPLVQTPPLLEPDQEVTVMATFDGKVARIFVDGAIQARANLWAAGCLVDAVCDSELILVRGILGACVAITALWFAPAGRRSHSVLLALAAGSAAMLLLYLLDKYSGALEITPLGPLCVLTGAVTVALSVRNYAYGSSTDSTSSQQARFL